MIIELRQGFVLPTVCPENFCSTEAALSLAVATNHRTVLFEELIGSEQRMAIHSLQSCMFVTVGVPGRPGEASVRLAVPGGHAFGRRS